MFCVKQYVLRQTTRTQAEFRYTLYPLHCYLNQSGTLCVLVELTH
jgi:hypothetical protein